MSAKILLARKLRTEARAHSILVGDAGFYWRDLPTETDLVAELRGERFSLIIVDHRDLGEDPLAFVETLRKWQKDTPVFVVSEQLALENVIRAIRVGVKDLFHPPIDLRAMVERIYAVLKPELGTSRGARLEEWSELMQRLTSNEIAPPAPGPVALGQVSAAPFPFLAEERDRLAAELKAAREAMVAAQARQAEFEAEVARLKAVKAAARAEEAAELAHREQALVEKDRQLAGAQKKLENELLLMVQTKTRAAQDRDSIGERPEGRAGVEAEMRLLAAEQEKCESEKQLALQLQAKYAQERAAVDQAEAARRTEVKQFKAQREKFATEQLRAAEGLARREAELARQEKELAGKESALQAVKEQAETTAAQATEVLAQIKHERGGLAAQEAALEQQAATLAERVRQFESRQLRIKEQVQQLLALG